MTDPATPPAARLLRTTIPNFTRGQRHAKPRPTLVAEGQMDELIALITVADPDDLWQYTLEMADGHHVRGAELRALLPDIEAPDGETPGSEANES